MLYSFVNIKQGDKLLEVLFPLRILKVNKYLIILTPLLNFIIYGIYKGLIASIIIIDYLGTTNNNKAYL
jgi:acetylglutamate synthase